MPVKKYISQKEVRKDNLLQFIKDTYEGDNFKAKLRHFYKSYREKLCAFYTENEADAKYKHLQAVIRGDTSKRFTKPLQDHIEQVFNLPENILSQVRLKRSPAYIFISCTGKTANLIFSEIQGNEIVDEISVLFGDIDVLIKVFGTPEEVQKLVTEDLYKIKDLEINNTKTYFTLGGKSWVRYSVSSHPSYTPPISRWE